jgi:hypothetical protein
MKTENRNEKLGQRRNIEEATVELTLEASSVDEGEQDTKDSGIEILKAANSDLNETERNERDEESDESGSPDWNDCVGGR